MQALFILRAPPTGPAFPAISPRRITTMNPKIIDPLDLIEKRRSPRYRAHWRVAIVCENDTTREIFHGRSHDISLTGISVYSDHNIFVESPVTILLAIPPLEKGQPKKIIEIRSKMLYTILASNNRGFRIGLKFVRFKGDGKKMLSENIIHRFEVL